MDVLILFVLREFMILLILIRLIILESDLVLFSPNQDIMCCYMYHTVSLIKNIILKKIIIIIIQLNIIVVKTSVAVQYEVIIVLTKLRR